MKQPFIKVTCEGVDRCKVGEHPIIYRPGDFILTHESAWTSRLIQIGQAFRFHKRDKKFAYWNHCAIIVSEDGGIIEAVGAGVRKHHISRYNEREYYLVKIKASHEDREQAVCFAQYCLGEKYGWITIVSIALSLLTGLKFSFGFDGQQICSGLIARAMERTWAIFNRSPSHITPADLAKYYDVIPAAY